VQRLIANGRAQLGAAPPVLADAQRQQLMPAEKALDDALNAIQRGIRSQAASAVNKLAVRLAAGSDRLAELVRRDQDFQAEAEAPARFWCRTGRSIPRPPRGLRQRPLIA
jgi:hypothetical protein